MTRAHDERMLRGVPYQIKATHAAGVHGIKTLMTSRNLRGDAKGAVDGTRIVAAAADGTDVFSGRGRGFHSPLHGTSLLVFQIFFFRCYAVGPIYTTVMFQLFSIFCVGIHSGGRSKALKRKGEIRKQDF